jgi:hypothetical protein
VRWAAAVTAALVIDAAAARAETFNVNTPVDDPALVCMSAGGCSLRGALLQSESTSEPDVINLPAGRYTLSQGPLEVRVSVFILGAGQNTTFIDGNQQSQIMVITAPAIVNISKVTFENGRGQVSQSGGAIFVGVGASLGLADCTVRNNGTDAPGGGIANAGFTQIDRCTISGNRVPAVGTGDLGGTQHSGGGIMNASGATLKILNSTVSDNQASRGGGIRNAGGHIELTNTTISGNKALARGGGIMNFGTAFIAFSTITNNDANSAGNLFCRLDGIPESSRACGGGIYNDNTGTDTGVVSLGNSILAGNRDNRDRFDSGYAPDCFSQVQFSFTSFRGNLVGILKPTTCAFADTIFGDTRFDQVGTPEAPLDPMLSSLTNNGGPTSTHALLPTSPAVDKGTGVTSATFFDCPAADQRSTPRPVGPACDVGAFELVPIAAAMSITRGGAVNLRQNVTDPQDARKLDAAIQHLTNALDPALFIDANTLVENSGARVFNQEKDAVVKFVALAASNDSDISTEAQALAVRTTDDTHALADVAVHQGLVAPDKPNQIAKAQDELGKGETAAAGGQYVVAIEHYRNAWRHAQKSSKE